MTPDHEWIADHIPHQGRMCLLDAVIDWDAQQLRARIGSHCAVDNPLRAHGRLGAVCGIEYAAQAVAVHGALLHPAPRADAFGMLTSARAVQLWVSRLDDIPQPLEVVVQRLQSDAHSALYEFSLKGPARELLRGRLSLLLSTGRSAAAAGANR